MAINVPNAQQADLQTQIVEMSDDTFKMFFDSIVDGLKTQNPEALRLMRVLPSGFIEAEKNRREVYAAARDSVKVALGFKSITHAQMLAGVLGNDPVTAERIARLMSEQNTAFIPAPDIVNKPSEATLYNDNISLRRQLANMNEQLVNLQKKFESLFNAVPAGVRIEEGAPPDSVNGWRVRISVPAFSIETTMGEVVAAREATGEAISWVQWHDRNENSRKSRERFRDFAKAMFMETITKKIIDSSNVVESIEVIEPPPELEPEPPSRSGPRPVFEYDAMNMKWKL